MPRLRSRLTGTVVNVDDATAAQLAGFDPVTDKQAESKPDPAPKRRPPARKK